MRVTLSDSWSLLVTVPIYYAKIYIIYNLDKQAIELALQETYELKDVENLNIEEDWNTSINNAQFSRHGNNCFVLLSEQTTVAQLMASLSHELFHLVHSLLEYKGMKHSRKSEEAYSYLIDYITHQIVEALYEKDSELVTVKTNNDE